MVKWVAPTTEPSSLILGYLLEVNRGFLGSDFLQVYDGSQDNNNLEFSVQGLTNGLYYTFRAYSVNFNGVSIASNEATYYACTSPT